MSNKEENINNTEKTIFDRIKSMNIKMKPRAYFIARTLLLVLGVIVLLLFIIYLVSFIIFSLRASGLLFLPRFGILGFKMLIGPLPWFLIFLSIGLVFLLEVLAKRFSFVYRRSILYSLFAIIIIVVFAGLIVGNTSFHPVLFRNAQERRLPIIGPFYRGHGAPMIKNVHHGIVSEIIDNGYIIETPNNQQLTLILGKDVLVRENIDVGDTIVAIGERTENSVRVFIIRKVTENRDIFPGRPLPSIKPLLLPTSTTLTK